MRHLMAFVLFASMLPLSAARGQSFVQSQEGIALENQILQLQQQVQGLQANGGGGGNGGSAISTPPPPSAGGTASDPGIVTGLLTQVQQLQAQVQTLNGQVDTLQNQMSTQHDATEKEIADLKFQMTGGGTAAGAATAAAAGAAATPSPGTAPPLAPARPAATASTPAATLRAGQTALSKHDYTTAEGAARSVLATAHGSPEGYQAQYLLGEALYSEGKPQDAAIAYDDAYNRARTGSNAPGALLGLANSLTAIHQAAAACDTLASLNSQFPTPPAGMAPRIAAAGHRAHCS